MPLWQVCKLHDQGSKISHVKIVLVPGGDIGAVVTATRFVPVSPRILRCIFTGEANFVFVFSFPYSGQYIKL